MNQTQQIERYLQNRMIPEDKLVMDAKYLLEPGFREKVQWQQQAYEVIQYYGRKKLKEEISTVQGRMFSESNFNRFRAMINKIFK